MTLFSGLPGSGKTTLALRLEAEGRGIRPTRTFTVAYNPVYRHALTLLRSGVNVLLGRALDDGGVEREVS